MVLML